MFKRFRNLLQDNEYRKILAVFLVFKIFVIVVAAGTQFVVPAELAHTEKVTDNKFLNPFAQYDATAYLDIAQNGYREDFGSYKAGNYHWYPLYPLLIKILGFMGYPLAAFLISNAASFFAITLLYLLVKEELGKRNAMKTGIYLMIFPTAFYFTMMYTESLFLLLSLAVFYYAKQGNWLAVGAVGFLVTLTRMQGILLLAPAAYMYLRTIDFKLPKINRKSIYLAGFPLGTATFMLYEYLITGHALIQFKSAVVFGKYLAWPWEGFLFSIQAVFSDATLINVSYHVFTLFMAAAFIALAIISYRKLRGEYTIYFALSLLVILLSSNLFGTVRYMLVAFPAFMTLSLIDKGRLKYGIIAAYAVFVLLMAGFIVLHATQRISLPILYTPIF